MSLWFVWWNLSGGAYDWNLQLPFLDEGDETALPPAGRSVYSPENEPYRQQVRRKLAAYHCHIQLGVIAQGVLQSLAVVQPEMVRGRFGSWLRTIRLGIPPSEQVVAMALSRSLPEFLADAPEEHILAKFIRQNLDLDRAEGLRLAS